MVSWRISLTRCPAPLARHLCSLQVFPSPLARWPAFFLRPAPLLAQVLSSSWGLDRRPSLRSCHARRRLRQRHARHRPHPRHARLRLRRHPPRQRHARHRPHPRHARPRLRRHPPRHAPPRLRPRHTRRHPRHLRHARPHFTSTRAAPLRWFLRRPAHRPSPRVLFSSLRSSTTMG